MKIILSNSENEKDVTNLVPNFTWSGEYKQCARSFEFGLLSSATDPNIDYVDCSVGSIIRLYDNADLLFYGYALSREKSTDGSVINIRCKDKGFYLNKNQASYKFTNVAPEEITKRVCADFNIKIGSVAQTKIGVSRIFLGVTLYDIIMTAYNLAAKKSGKKYMVTFKGEELYVIEKTETSNAFVVDSNINLMAASYSESIENMTNQIAIYDKNDKFVKYVKNDEYVKLFGVMQGYMKQTDKDNMTEKAQKELKDNGIERKVSVENLGDLRCITGNSVIVKEPYTGLNGLFYIDADTHTWKNGLYVNKLTLNFENMMDEKTVGTEPKK